MNKTELLSLLEGRLGSRRAAIDALDSVLAEIQQAVAAGERVTLTGFGTFERVERAARTGRNPRTGATIEIAASATPRFHPGASLRAAVAGTTVAGTAGTKPEPRAKARPAASGTAARATTRAKAAPAPASEAAKPGKAGKKSKAGKDEKPAKKASSSKKKKK